jgi:hypothetical protein
MFKKCEGECIRGTRGEKKNYLMGKSQLYGRSGKRCQTVTLTDCNEQVVDVKGLVLCFDSLSLTRSNEYCGNQ